MMANGITYHALHSLVCIEAFKPCYFASAFIIAPLFEFLSAFGFDLD